MKLIKKYAIFALVLMMAVQLPICASDLESSISNDISGIATNLSALAVMSAKGLLSIGQKTLSLTHTLTTFMKEHPVIACTVGLSAYAAWRVMKYKYGNRIYHILGNPQPHTHYYCPHCDQVVDASFLIV